MGPDVHILLVDDHPAVREAVRMRLEAVRRFKVVAEAADIPEALAKTEATRPHLALLDIGLGKMSGLLLARVLHERFPEVRILIWSMHAKPDYVTEARRAGACGYVLKNGPLNEIVTAIEAVLAGGSYYSANVDRDTFARSPLTAAEKPVLGLVARGLSSREIAKRLKVEPRTIETHRRNIMAKLGAKNVVQLVTIAIGIGLALMGHSTRPDRARAGRA
jgi:DNA-binding NarL/FixJ family response regulator